MEINLHDRLRGLVLSILTHGSEDKNLVGFFFVLCIFILEYIDNISYTAQDDEEWNEVEEEAEKDYTGLRVQNLQISYVTVYVYYTVSIRFLAIRVLSGWIHSRVVKTAKIF